jgi:membrane protease YdiL (CAAX protease family)
MVLLAWVVAPILIPLLPIHPGITFWILMIIGMAWQFVFSLIILRRELGHLSWDAIKKRTSLNLPRDPRTGKKSAKLFWWVLPALLFSALTGLFLSGYLDAPISWLFPTLEAPAYTNVSELANPQFQGQWWILGVALASLLFNYFLGEEFLFRGILLPKMSGVFGRWDWVANTVLFGLYHLHIPWGIPSAIVSSLAIVWPARRFRSNWMAIIVHGAEGISILILVIGVLIGLMP